VSGQRLVEIDFPAQADSLRGMRGVVADAARSAGCSQALTEQLVLALDEACTNIIRHAYRDNPCGQIVLTIDRRDNQLVFRLRDFAAGVDVDRIRPRKNRALRPGGLGMRLIDSIMDSWEFQAPDEGQGNLLTMIRTIG
jgi:sigma-B regulation protein RsbU (phosphoserine phosphatase)